MVVCGKAFGNRQNWRFGLVRKLSHPISIVGMGELVCDAIYTIEVRMSIRVAAMEQNSYAEDVGGHTENVVANEYIDPSVEDYNVIDSSIGRISRSRSRRGRAKKGRGGQHSRRELHTEGMVVSTSKVHGRGVQAW